LASSYFLPGEATDPGYANVRDSPNLIEAKAFTESLWEIYQPFADKHAQLDAQKHFRERFWEMYVACAFLKRGVQIHKAGDAGPEFYFKVDRRRVWVEAVAPGAGEGPDKVPAIVFGDAYTVPDDKVVLRFTSVVQAKLQKLKSDVSKGLLGEDESVILAINSRGVPHAPYPARIPYFVKAVLPFGNLTLEIDRATKAVMDQYHVYHPEIHKENNAPVSTAIFLDPSSAQIAAVIHSGVDCANRPVSIGAEFDVLHNPSANTPLPRSLFRWCAQHHFSENELHSSDPEPEV
jgi:hypothetical protein